MVRVSFSSPSSQPRRAARARLAGPVAAVLGVLAAGGPAAALQLPPADIPQAGAGTLGGAPIVQVQSTAQYAEQSMRIDRLEAEMRRLNGQIEELLFQLRQQQQQMQRAQEDMEFRFQEMEGGTAPRPRTDAAPPAGRPAPSGDFAAAPPAGSRAVPDYGAESGFGAPPSDLGTLPGEAVGAGAGASGVFDGPLDLSAIARGGDFGAPGTTGAVGGADFGSLPGVDGTGGPIGGTPRLPDAGQDVATILAPSNPRDAYEQSYSYIVAGNYEMAEMGFRQFLRDHPDDDLAGNAHFWLGEAYFARQQFRDAADEFLETYKSYPASQKAPESLLKLGLSLAGLGEPEAACATYAELVSKYPNAPRAVVGRVEAERAKASC